MVMITVLGVVYDAWATKQSARDSHWFWSFNHAQTLGVRFFGLPLEEILFYTCTSGYIIIMWEGVKVGYAAGRTDYLYILIAAALWTFTMVLCGYYFYGYKR